MHLHFVNGVQQLYHGKAPRRNAGAQERLQLARAWATLNSMTMFITITQLSNLKP